MQSRQSINIQKHHDVIQQVDAHVIDLKKLLDESWQVIAPAWPVNQFIATNPLQGLVNLPFESAWNEASSLFQMNELPEPMLSVNRESIKWLQVFFDRQVAKIHMPDRQKGFYKAWRNLIPYDEHIHQGKSWIIQWLEQLPESAEAAITQCLVELQVPSKEHHLFCTLLLTTLPGWSSYVKYYNDFKQDKLFALSKVDYLAMRLVLTYLFWPKAASLLKWHASIQTRSSTCNLDSMKSHEKKFQAELIQSLESASPGKQRQAKAQFIFCIDPRSEPVRAALESVGHYHTFGYAGFFGLPMEIDDNHAHHQFTSCPAIVPPKHKAKLSFDNQYTSRVYKIKHFFQRQSLALFKSLKSNVLSAFCLAEATGPIYGMAMAMQTINPLYQQRSKTSSWFAKKPDQHDLSRSQQFEYAKIMLKMIGLTHNFAPIVVLCAHGSQSKNNAYDSALQCGACGGQSGQYNADLLATILNQTHIRAQLEKDGIHIPLDTTFLSAIHITSTDEIIFSEREMQWSHTHLLSKIKSDISSIQQRLNAQRLQRYAPALVPQNSTRHCYQRSRDWSQVRPEWGLVNNACMVIGPRENTETICFNSRAFLHSYDHRCDPKAEYLNAILNGPLMVAHWINMQYMCSTLDNVSFGGGCKTTKNITGMYGVMQGNASDLMHGFPYQSLYDNPDKPFHRPVRLTVIIEAPKLSILKVIEQNPQLSQLIQNEWLFVFCRESNHDNSYRLSKDMQWVAPKFDD